MKNLFLMTIIAVTITVTSCSKFTGVQTQAIEWLVQEGSILATDSIAIDTAYRYQGTFIFDDGHKMEKKWQVSELTVYGDVFEKRFRISQRDTTGAIDIEIIGIDYAKWIYDQLKQNGVVDSTSGIIEMKEDHGLFLTDNGQKIIPVMADQIDGKNHSMKVTSNVITEYPDNLDTINKYIKNLIINYTLKTFKEKPVFSTDTTIIKTLEYSDQNVLLLIDELNEIRPIMIDFSKSDSSAHVFGGITMQKTKEWKDMEKPFKELFVKVTVESFKANIDGFRELSQ
jgi:hypothetical protein